mmetsp:Transcript_12795/g.18345  ORF Transcript_12795/g.18345 Transcript_12795/m.18345 type:complete len:276 (-) Transcript_12795:136-963(-)
MTNVSHATSNENFVNLIPSNLTQQGTCVRIIGQGQDGFLDLVHVDFNNLSILSIVISLHQMRIGQPIFHTSNTPLQGTRVTISLRNHPLEHDNIGLQVLNDGLLVQLDGTSGSRTFGRGITQFKRLFTLQIGKTFNLQHTAREDILLALLLDSEKPILNCRVGDGLHQIPQGDTGLHRSSETNKDRLGHIQWEYTRGGSKGDQSTSGGEGHSQWETSVRISTSSDSVGNKHTIQPRVDDTITGTQTDTTPSLDKVGQGVMGNNIHRLGIRSSMTE